MCNCDGCGEFVCNDCMTDCSDCGNVICDECKIKCRKCGDIVCERCINEDEKGRQICSGCYDKIEEKQIKREKKQATLKACA